MADHVRKQIRDAVVVQLTGLTTTGAKVFPSRVYSLEAASVPALLVYTNSESASVVSLAPSGRDMGRTLEIVIEAVAKANSGLDDALDTIITEVEIALGDDITLGGLLKDLQLTAIDVSLSGDAQKPTGSARMTWTAEYWTAEGAPTLAT